MRTPDGRLTVKGLMPGQQLIQTSDGKLQVVTTTQIQQQQQQQLAQNKTTPQSAAVKAAIAKNANAAGKICMEKRLTGNTLLVIVVSNSRLCCVATALKPSC